MLDKTYAPVAQRTGSLDRGRHNASDEPNNETMTAAVAPRNDDGSPEADVEDDDDDFEDDDDEEEVLRDKKLLHEALVKRLRRQRRELLRRIRQFNRDISILCVTEEEPRRWRDFQHSDCHRMRGVKTQLIRSLMDVKVKYGESRDAGADPTRVMSRRRRGLERKGETVDRLARLLMGIFSELLAGDGSQ